jgi:hypothetical protein
VDQQPLANVRVARSSSPPWKVFLMAQTWRPSRSKGLHEDRARR